MKQGAIIAVGGGKGGVGKSVFSIALGAALAGEGTRVVLADLDLGAANLHTYLGVTGATPSIADFILKRTSSLEKIVLPTRWSNLSVISGAEFVPGMANPPAWMKAKIIRHLRSLPADHVIIDLGAGVHFNTLDFFGIADRGVVVTAPEPGAVINAYGFIKGAFFRKLQQVFGNHAAFSGLMGADTEQADAAERITLESFAGRVRELAPDMLPLISEIRESFRPVLVVNRMAPERPHVLVTNLLALCGEKLGVAVDHAGSLPDVPGISEHLLNIPGFLDRPEARSYMTAVKKIARDVTGREGKGRQGATAVQEFSDEDRDRILALMEGLDDSVFEGTSRELWKLRMYFRPADVTAFLRRRGVTPVLPGGPSAGGSGLPST